MLQQQQQLERLIELERLERTKSLEELERLEFYNQDCIQFLNSLPPEIIDNAIIYIDPPYKGTATYKEGTNDLHEQIKKFALDHKDKCPVYISEYSVYEGLTQCFYENKQQLLTSLKDTRTIKKELLLYNNYAQKNELLFDLLGLGVWVKMSI